MQSRRGSLAESCTNILVGGSLNWIATLFIVPILWNPGSPKMSSFYMTLFYTAVSLARSFTLRRWFNKIRWGNR